MIGQRIIHLQKSPVLKGTAFPSTCSEREQGGGSCSLLQPVVPCAVPDLLSQINSKISSTLQLDASIITLMPGNISQKGTFLWLSFLPNNELYQVFKRNYYLSLLLLLFLLILNGLGQWSVPPDNLIAIRCNYYVYCRRNKLWTYPETSNV